MHQFVLKKIKNLLGHVHGVIAVHLGFLDHGLGHESSNVGEVAW
jgi:hypothetical protein